MQQYIINRFSRDIPDLGDLTDLLPDRGIECYSIEQDGKHILVVVTAGSQEMVSHLLKEWDIDATPLQEGKEETALSQKVVLQLFVHRAEPMRNVRNALGELENTFKVTDFHVDQCQEHRVVLVLLTSFTEEEWERLDMGTRYHDWAENAQWVSSYARIAQGRRA